MRRAGNYDTRLTWLKYVAVRDDSTGQQTDSFEENGYLWASVADKSADKLPSIGLPVSQSTTEIRITNFPAIGFKDQLLEKGSEAYYTIDGITRGDEELILGCTRKQVR